MMSLILATVTFELSDVESVSDDTAVRLHSRSPAKDRHDGLIPKTRHWNQLFGGSCRKNFPC